MSPKRKAEAMQIFAQDTTWTVSMNNGFKWIDGRGWSRKHATLECLSNVVDDMIEKPIDRDDFLNTALDILKHPEQNEDLWRSFALKHKKYQSQLQQLFHTINTCIMKRDLWVREDALTHKKKASEEEKTSSIDEYASVRPIPLTSVSGELVIDWDEVQLLQSL